MTQPNLHINSGSRGSGPYQDARPSIDDTKPSKTVSIPLATLVPVLLEAAIHNSSWLSDFAEDSVRIDEDLYEVLLAFGHLRRRAA